MQAFRGYCIESIRHQAHNTLRKGGEFRCRDLQDCEEGTVTLPPSKRSKVLPSFAAISELEEDVYGQSGKEVSGIDAMLNGCLFQITVCQTHPIKLETLLSIAEEAGGLEGLKLYFAVDQHAFESTFERQQIVKKKGEEVDERKKSAMEMPQFLLLLPKPDADAEPTVSTQTG